MLLAPLLWPLRLWPHQTDNACAPLLGAIATLPESTALQPAIDDALEMLRRKNQSTHRREQ